MAMLYFLCSICLDEIVCDGFDILRVEAMDNLAVIALFVEEVQRNRDSKQCLLHS